MFQDDFFIITIPFLEGAIAPKCQISNTKCTTTVYKRYAYSNILKKVIRKNKKVVIENK